MISMLAALEEEEKSYVFSSSEWLDRCWFQSIISTKKKIPAGPKNDINSLNCPKFAYGNKLNNDLQNRLIDTD